MSEAGIPSWRCGALMADLEGRWSREWLAWDGFPDLFGRILELVWPRRGPVGIRWSREGDEVRVVAEVREGNRWVNGLGLRGELVGEGTKGEVEFRQTGPGRYEAVLPLPPPGAYSLTVYEPAGRYGGTISVSIPYAPEFESLGADREALEKLAELGGGKLLRDEVLPLAPGDGTRWLPLRRAFFLLSGLAFLLDLLRRKLSP